jgi:hypothetical protein
MPTQPHDHDPIQGGVGLTVPTPVQPVPDRLARGGRDRRGTTPHREGRFAAQPPWVIAGATNSAPAISGPTPPSCPSPGAALVVSRSSSASTRASSAAKACSRSPNRRRASLVAAVVVAIGPGRSRAAVLASWVAGRSRSCSPNSAGAVTTSAPKALAGWVRALAAVALATRSQRTLSTRWSPPWGWPWPGRRGPPGPPPRHRSDPTCRVGGEPAGRAGSPPHQLALGGQKPNQPSALTPRRLHAPACHLAKGPGQASNPDSPWAWSQPGSWPGSGPAGPRRRRHAGRREGRRRR